MSGLETDYVIAYGPPEAEKKLEPKRKNLIRLGVDPDHAYAWSRTRKGGWAVAHLRSKLLYH